MGIKCLKRRIEPPHGNTHRVGPGLSSFQFPIGETRRAEYYRERTRECGQQAARGFVIRGFVMVINVHTRIFAPCVDARLSSTFRLCAAGLLSSACSHSGCTKSPTDSFKLHLCHYNIGNQIYTKCIPSQY